MDLNVLNKKFLLEKENKPIQKFSELQRVKQCKILNGSFGKYKIWTVSVTGARRICSVTSNPDNRFKAIQIFCRKKVLLSF